jgi:starch-binding outer membrane protein, SusD/RagB family
MKKSVIPVMLLLLFGAIANSCNDSLDLMDDGRKSVSDIFTSSYRIEAFLLSCYDQRAVLAKSLNTAAYTDESFSANAVNSGNIQNWYDGQTTATTFATQIQGGSPWTNLYNGIGMCNIFLTRMKNLDLNVVTDVNEVEKKGWMSQAYTLRALYYLGLVQRYGQVPLVVEERSADYDYSKDRRASLEECADAIIADCDSALGAAEGSAYFPWSYSNSSTGIMSRAVAWSIKSQIALLAASPLWNPNQTGKYTWKKAAEITGDALSTFIDNNGNSISDHGGLALYTASPLSTTTQNSYSSYMLLKGNDLSRSTDVETIYHIGGQQTATSYNGLPVTQFQMTSGVNPTQELVDCYETADGENVLDLTEPYIGGDHTKPNYNSENTVFDRNNPYQNRDPRFYASIYYNGAQRRPGSTATTTDGISIVQTYRGGNCGLTDLTVNTQRYTKTGYYLRKFCNHTTSSFTNNDGSIKFFRLTELYLNFAEAANEAYGPQAEAPCGKTALWAVNQVRARVNMPGFTGEYAADQTKFRLKLRNERRVEFAFEAVHFLDVRRWSKPTEDLSQTDKTVTGIDIKSMGDNAEPKLLYSGSGVGKAMAVNPAYQKAGVQFTSTAPFHYVSVLGYGNLKNLGTITISVYNCDGASNGWSVIGDASKLVAKKEFKLFLDQSWLQVSKTDNTDFPAGSYIWVADNASVVSGYTTGTTPNNCGIYLVSKSNASYTIQSYADGTAISGAFQSRLETQYFDYSTRFALNRDCYSNKYLFYPIPPDEISKMSMLTGSNFSQNPNW